MFFQGWAGSTNAKAISAGITMDGPKTVTALWAADNTQPYIILGGMLAAIIIILAAVIVLMNRGKRWSLIHSPCNAGTSTGPNPARSRF